MISIIVPIYNSEKYLKKCVNSILKQTYRNIELILINDASTDRCFEICAKFLSKDNRIKLITNSNNLGVELSRMQGIRIAKGDFILFIDSDDYLSNKKVIEIMYNKAIESDADYVEVKAKKVLDHLGLFKKEITTKVQGQIITPVLFEDYYISFFGLNLLTFSIWGKLFKKEIIKKIDLKPSGYIYGEDRVFFLQLFPKLKKIYILNYYGYNYRYGGMSTRYNPIIFKNLENLFYYKKKLIQQYKYYKASECLLNELKEICKSQIKLMIEFSGNNKDEIVKFILKLRFSPIYKNIIDSDKNSMLWNDNFMILFYNYKAEEIYNKFYNEIKKYKYLFFAGPPLDTGRKK
ncbi:MAG: glycosyltransferase family 2 protein [Muribaculaceae bacterium]|nr:glycosyltransferase family 2 protein [Muribaculaceae bacterium]